MMLPPIKWSGKWEIKSDEIIEIIEMLSQGQQVKHGRQVHKIEDRGLVKSKS